MPAPNAGLTTDTSASYYYGKMSIMRACLHI